MTTPNHEPIARRPLRLWPGVAAASLQWALILLGPLVPDGAVYSMLGGVVCGLVILLWWLFFSRAPWLDRLGALAVMIATPFVVRLFVDRSIENAGQGMFVYAFSIPLLSLALVAWAVATRGSSASVRRVSMVVALFVGCSAMALLRTGGISGSGGSDLHWRWSQTPEEKLLAEARDEPKVVAPAATPAESPKAPAAADSNAAPSTAATPAAPAPTAAAPASSAPPKIEKADAAPAAAAKAEPITTPAEWPGFRGRDRDGHVPGVRINTDWSATPPTAVWRRAIGPGWSSFSVRGDYLYTQEQRGQEEMVACYRVSTGEPVWRHRDPVRFWESNGGAGPRATPTISGNRIYAFGATGILNALDAATGTRLWSHNVSQDTGRRVPDWGFSSSPLVIDDLVIVAASGSLAAYDRMSGERRWIGTRQLGSYSSPHLATIGGVKQVLLLSASGAAGFAPADGKLLWQYDWQTGATTIIQPALTEDGDILVNAIGMTGGAGVRRLTVTHSGEGWKVEERWASMGLKPYFNDLVVHKGHAYGFDGNILSCIDLADGTRKWKGGRYGNGQMVLLPDQDLLIVLSEEGELALVGATPDRFNEIARAPAIEGKTWNHPVLVRDLLLVRNGEHMAAFRLSLATETSASSR